MQSQLHKPSAALLLKSNCRSQPPVFNSVAATSSVRYTQLQSPSAKARDSEFSCSCISSAEGASTNPWFQLILTTPAKFSCKDQSQSLNPYLTSTNGFITWMLHHIFMFYNKVNFTAGWNNVTPINPPPITPYHTFLLDEQTHQ